MFNLMPKNVEFFAMFEKLALHVSNASKLLIELGTQFPAITGVVQRIREEEHQADELAHQTLESLDRTFITPFDREDIHELVGGLDDVIDEIDAVAKRFLMYHVQNVAPMFQKQSQVLADATSALCAAVQQLCKTRKLSELHTHLIEVHRLENVGDDNHQAAVSSLFEGKVETLEVIKWMDLFARIEKAIDKCDTVSNTLERIMLKNG